METMKENWICPDAQVQKFAPEEYVTSCWLVRCDLPGYFFVDHNKSGNYDVLSERVHSNQDHTDLVFVQLSGNDEPAFNGYYSTGGHTTGGMFSNQPDNESYSTTTGAHPFRQAYWFAEGSDQSENRRIHISSLGSNAVFPYADSFHYDRRTGQYTFGNPRLNHS